MTNHNEVMPSARKPATTYHERKIGKTLYRTTNVYKGEIDLAKSLEDLAVRKILNDSGPCQS